MDVVAVASPSIYLQDLVSFGRGILRQGTVIQDATVENSSLPVDTLRILLIDNSVVYKNAGDIRVLDRNHLHPGQVVGSASDIAGQIGVVTGVTTHLVLAERDNRGMATGVTKGVCPSTLRRISSLTLGDFVVSGPWLGRVVEVSVDVDVLFDDGAVCRVTNADSKILQEVDATGSLRHKQKINCYFYPGQIVQKENSCSIFKAARWLNGYWNPDRYRGTIIKVEMSGVLVYWIASMHCGTDRELVEASAPPAYQHPDELTFFCAASSCSWWVSDQCFFREPRSAKTDDDNGNVAIAHDQEVEEEEEEENDDPCSENNEDVIDSNQDAPIAHGVPPTPTKQNGVIFYGKQLRKVFFEGHRRERRPQVRKHVEVEFPMSVASTNTSIDVIWQDGTQQHGIPSASLIPFDVINEQEFFPGQHVVENDTTVGTNGDNDCTTKRVGIVRSLNFKDQTVCVSWFKAGICPDEPREVECIDTISAYDLKLNYSPYYGDIVVRLVHSESTNNGASAALDGKKKKKKKKIAAHVDLSWVGHVVNLPHGQVQVKWGDGSMSTVSPHEIVVVNEDHYMELATEMGDWVEADGIDEEATSTDNNDPHNPAKSSDVENEDPAATTTSILGFVVRSLLQLTGDMVARETIYTRVFEDRMDLLRVVMVGASGTPYHRGLFFFDLQLPSSYPAEPPQVYYHSYGLRLNPNLYESGTVCLSLLNTFDGEGTELWSSVTSSLLQVVVSIQGLVLNDQPYYNEAGYETLLGKPEGRRNALPYSENAYLLSLRTILHVLRRPPLGFEEFIKDHFRRQGRFVLTTCDAFLRGCIVGDSHATEAIREQPCSAGLKLALTNILPSLMAAFTEIGAEGCEEFPKSYDLNTTH
ncbi:hypothetical protein QYE76_047471 [Lolium multiflorum]|uniref:UBC core domain-containing protein n=1 Tax=Lolium multiflorum TaxID=4521 RepID=A0AAD8TRN2_LOLMU|nr:hypothetical protein QYE76_047471 [Lolium multiflorum]